MSEEIHKARDVLAAEEFGVPAPDPQLQERDAHDVLAAEEFGVPAPDPVLKDRAARDVLAAEEFGVPAPDPGLLISGTPIPLPVNPSDPDNVEPPRDVLAAEEFAMPGQEPRAVPPDFTPEQTAGRGRPDLRIGAVGLAVAVVVVRKLRHRRRG